MHTITLYYSKNKDISIHIQVYFDDEKLVIEGYDIGKRVEEAWGDSVYEYVTTIPENEVKKLYFLMKVIYEDKEGLLRAIANVYNSNTCYSEFNDFLEKNGIESEGFSWA